MRNKNIIFLSGTDTSDNRKALTYIKEKYPKFKKVCYLPAEQSDSEDEIKQAKKDFKKHNKTGSFEVAFLDSEKTSVIKKKIQKADILFLGGGNTFHFFDQIAKHRLNAVFRKHLTSGKLLMGLSAGGIVITPSLMMACYPSKDADDCSSQRKDFKALSYVPFEVCPHYKASKAMVKDLLVYSSLHTPVLYGIKDGDFIAVNEDEVHFSGKCAVFFRGEQVKIK